MKLALLRFFARRPLALVALTGAALLGAAAAAVAAASSTEPCAQDASAQVDPQDNPRKILSRGWFDSWPEKRRDNLKFFFFGGGGWGIFEEGSSYRYAVDVF